MRNKEARKGIRNRRIYWLAVIILVVGLAYVSEFYSEEQLELSQNIRNTVEKTFPEQVAEIERSFGLISLSRESKLLQQSPGSNSVVLIHGLDDPGKVWMNLGPALIAKNMDVWLMRYPNDQSIGDSARFFYAQMELLKQTGVNQVAIVAHSMGGLVSREMLTNPQTAYSDKAIDGDVPVVKSLVMVGTPNHGSELARFRVFSEIRDQWVNLVESQGNILRGILDGAGEAKTDLLPQSLFLQTLNKRPHPERLKMLIIAGQISPWDGVAIEEFFDSDRKTLSDVGKKLLSELETFALSMSDGLGDGLVTVASTRLQGIEHRLVPGTHLSMIRNISIQSSRIPSAIPLIIRFLEEVSGS